MLTDGVLQNEENVWNSTDAWEFITEDSVKIKNVDFEIFLSIDDNDIIITTTDSDNGIIWLKTDFDDGYFYGTVEEVMKFWNFVKDKGPEVGYHLMTSQQFMI